MSKVFRSWMWSGTAAVLGLVIAASSRAQCWTSGPFYTSPPAHLEWVEQKHIVYDAARQCVVQWENDRLYELHNTTWTQIQTADQPPSRQGASLAYDADRGVTWMFGGLVLVGTTWVQFDDLWFWDGSAWTQIPRVGTWPGPRRDMCLVYNPTRNVLVMHGGETGVPAAPVLLAETWEFDLNTGAWTLVGTTAPPNYYPSAFASEMFYDIARSELILVVTGNPVSTWVWSGSSWVLRQAGGMSPRVNIGLAYDTNLGQCVLFGGNTLSLSGNYADAYIWNGASWTDSTPLGSTGHHHAMVYDSVRRYFIRPRFEWGPPVGTQSRRIWDGLPGFIAHPAGGTYCPGANAVLSVTAASETPVTYQWRRNAQPVAGGTSSILVIPSVSAATAGVYDCIVTNTCGSTASHAASVTLRQPPAITSQPIGQDRCPGQNVLIVGPGVSGTNPEIKLQWDNFGTWVNVPNQYNPVGNFYVLPNAQNNQSGWYRFEASNSCGVAYTQPFHIQIGVSISGGPLSIECDPCEVRQFSLTAAGVGPTLTYEWRRNGVTLIDNGHIAGAATPTLTINGVRFEDEGVYTCRVTDACETQTSGGGHLVMKAPQWVHRTSSGPLRRHSTDLAYDASRGVCVLYGGLSPITFSSIPNDETWEWDGVEWTRRFPAHNPNGRQRHEMVYDSVRNKVLLFGGWPNGTNGAADVWEYDGNDWTLLLTTPAGGPPTSHGDAAFDPVRARMIVLTNYAVSGPSPNQTWEFDPVTLAWQKTFEGTGAYWYDSPLGYDAARDIVLGTSFVWYNLSNPHTWRYTGTGWTEILNSQMPDRQTPVLAFDTFRQKMIMFGCCRKSLSTSYFFFHNDTYSFDGATWSPYLSEFHPALADRVQPMGMAFDSKRNAMVVVGNSWNTNVGMNALDTWEYRYLDKVVFDRQPQDQPLTIGGSAQLKVFAAGAGTLTYQWRKGNTPLVNGPTPGGSVISGATTNTLTITGLTAADAGTYRCQVSNACGSALSDPADLGSVCYPDCNGDGAVTVADFGCFQTAFISGNLYADCNQSGTLTIADFGCFQTAFVVGCP